MDQYERNLGPGSIVGWVCAIFFALTSPVQALEMLPNPVVYTNGVDVFAETTVTLVDSLLGVAPAGSILLSGNIGPQDTVLVFEASTDIPVYFNAAGVGVLDYPYEFPLDPPVIVPIDFSGSASGWIPGAGVDVVDSIGGLGNHQTVVFDEFVLGQVTDRYFIAFAPYDELPFGLPPVVLDSAVSSDTPATVLLSVNLTIPGDTFDPEVPNSLGTGLLVPEPSSAVLFSLGLVGLAAGRRRRAA